MTRPTTGRQPDRLGGRVSRRRAKVREQLLDVAERAFAASGYREVRMDDLAEAVDVSVGTIYGHFGSKDGLFLALGERAAEQFGAYLDRAYQPGYSPLEKVLACGDAYLRFHLEHPDLFRFLAGVESQLPRAEQDQQTRVGQLLAANLRRFEEHIAAAITSGEASSEYDATVVARFLWGAWNGVVALGLRTDELALTDAEIAECLQLGRRVVNEGLTAPGFRDATGRSRARLHDTSTT